MSFRFFQSVHYQRSKFMNKVKKVAQKLWISVILTQDQSETDWNLILDSIIGIKDRNLHWQDFNDYIGSTNFSDGSSISTSMYEVTSRIESSKGKIKTTIRSWFSFEINHKKNYFKSLVKVEDTHHKFELVIHWEYLIALVLPIALFIDHVLYYWYPSSFMIQFLLYPLAIAWIFIALTSRKHRKRNRTQLEDTTFEGDLDVITQHPVYARQILTPDIMSKITERNKTFNHKIKPTIIFRSSICEIQCDLSRYNWLWFFSHSYTPYIRHLEEVYHAALEFKKIVDEDIVSRLWNTNYTDRYIKRSEKTGRSNKVNNGWNTIITLIISFIIKIFFKR